MLDTAQQKHRFDLADFEQWAQLAASDPEAFEAHRSHVIEDFISSAPVERQARLRCLQWRIDQIRRTSRTPLAACIRISRMMWDSVLGTGGLHEVLNSALQGVVRAQPAPAPLPGATVLPFRGRSNRH